MGKIPFEFEPRTALGIQQPAVDFPEFPTQTRLGMPFAPSDGDGESCDSLEVGGGWGKIKSAVLNALDRGLLAIISTSRSARRT